MMKKLIVLMVIVLTGYSSRLNAQIAAAEAVKLVVKKVIKAIDLQVQRMQNKTIWLQNAQKTLENELSKYRLAEIGNWSDKQRALYDAYYRELWQVKAVIAYYQQVKDIGVTQAALVREYQQAWRLFQADKHFRPAELREMGRVYIGILEASAQDLDQVLLVIHPGKTQMSDQQRLEMIHQASDRLDEHYRDLKQYNNQNKLVSLQRSQDFHEIQTFRKYYGLR